MPRGQGQEVTLSSILLDNNSTLWSWGRGIGAWRLCRNAHSWVSPCPPQERSSAACALLCSSEDMDPGHSSESMALEWLAHPLQPPSHSHYTPLSPLLTYLFRGETADEALSPRLSLQRGELQCEDKDDKPFGPSSTSIIDVNKK